MDDFSAEATARRAAAHEMAMRMSLHIALNLATRRVVMGWSRLRLRRARLLGTGSGIATRSYERGYPVPW